MDPMSDEKAIARLADVPLKVRAELDRRRLRVRDVLELSVGSVISLKKPAGESVDILVEGVRVGSGDVVASAKTLSVRVTRFGGRS
jgi:flagellar motor switch protein FliN